MVIAVAQRPVHLLGELVRRRFALGIWQRGKCSHPGLGFLGVIRKCVRQRGFTGNGQIQKAALTQAQIEEFIHIQRRCIADDIGSEVHAQRMRADLSVSGMRVACRIEAGAACIWMGVFDGVGHLLNLPDSSCGIGNPGVRRMGCAQPLVLLAVIFSDPVQLGLEALGEELGDDGFDVGCGWRRRQCVVIGHSWPPVKIIRENG